MWFNFHTHSTYCDGKSNLQQLIAEAEKLNLISLGFSSHAPLPFESKWCMKKEILGSYLNEIRHLKKNTTQLQLYAGLEVDYIPYFINPKDFSSQLDYTIGSVHFVEKFSDGRGWEIDGTHSFFLEGLEQIFKKNFRKACERYFELTREMVETSAPDVVGHLDKIKMQNIANIFFHETDSWYVDQLDLTLEAIKKAGSIVEVNTRGVYQKKTSTTYPSPWILEKIIKKKIPVTVSSDAHHTSDLINHFSKTLTGLKQMGFNELFVLYDQKWQPFAFDENGIKDI